MFNELGENSKHKKTKIVSAKVLNAKVRIDLRIYERVIKISKSVCVD